MNITVQHLTSTGIGRTVNALRKDDGEIGMAAKALISKWKQMVASQESDGEEGDGNGNGNADADADEEEEPQINYDYEREHKIQTESIGDCERRSHKTHEHLPKSSTSNNNNHHHHQETHHHHHHRDPNHRHAHGKTSDNHNMNRKVMSSRKGPTNHNKLYKLKLAFVSLCFGFSCSFQVMTQTSIRCILHIQSISISPIHVMTIAVGLGNGSTNIMRIMAVKVAQSIAKVNVTIIVLGMLITYHLCRFFPSTFFPAFQCC